MAAAKTIAYARRLPLVPVNHLQGHIAAAYAQELPAGTPPAPAEPPFVCLVASGGHTLLAVVEEGVDFRVAGRTLDDAAGEAFDKGARLLGLPYPGGAELDRLAAQGDPTSRALPAGHAPRSGLQLQRPQDRAALLPARADRSRRARAAGRHRRRLPERAMVRQLVDKAVRCAEAEGLRTVAVAGGVAANSGLRAALVQECERRGLRAHLPPLALCTDNAAMIGLAAAYLPAVPWPDYLALDAYAAAAATSARGRAPRRSRSVRAP